MITRTDIPKESMLDTELSKIKRPCFFLVNLGPKRNGQHSKEKRKLQQKFVSTFFALHSNLGEQRESDHYAKITQNSDFICGRVLR